MAIKRYDITTKLGLLLEPFSSGQLDIQEAWLELDGDYRDPDGFFMDHPEATGYIRYTLGGQQFEYSNLSFYDPNSEQSSLGHLKLDENGDLLLIRDDFTPVSAVYLCRDSNVKVYLITVLPPASVFPNKIGAQFWHSDQETPDVESFPPVEDWPMVLGSEVGSGGGGSTVTRYDITAKLAEIFEPESNGDLNVLSAWIDLQGPTGANGYFAFSDFSAAYIEHEWQGQVYTSSPILDQNAGITNLRLGENGELVFDAQSGYNSTDFKDVNGTSIILALGIDAGNIIVSSLLVKPGELGIPPGSLGAGVLLQKFGPETTPLILSSGSSGSGGGSGGGSGVSLPSATSVVGGKAVATVSVNPTLVEVTLSGQALPVGSILRNSSEGGKKYLKIAGGATAFKSISVQPDVSWNWDADGAAAWAVLQNK